MYGGQSLATVVVAVVAAAAAWQDAVMWRSRRIRDRQDTIDRMRDGQDVRLTGCTVDRA